MAKKTREEIVFEEACATLRKAGLKRTPHRESLLRFLIHHHGPFQKEEILKGLGSEDMDGVTLYRNLIHLEKAGLVRRCEFGDGISRYEFQIHPDRHHHHVVCVECRKIDSLEDCNLTKLESAVRKLGYSEVQHSLEFYGICGDCAKKSA